MSAALAGAVRSEIGMIDDPTLKAWFAREIFSREASLTRFIRRNWRNEADVADLRQEVYARVYAAARDGLPLQAKPFLFTTAKNHMLNSAKRAAVVSITHVADLEVAMATADLVTPDRTLMARDELRRVQLGLDRLPPRCRQVVMLRKIDGLSTREVAARLNLGHDTVEQQLVRGMRALADFMRGGSGKIQRSDSRRRKPKATAQ